LTQIRELATFISQLQLRDVPKDVQEAATLHILDTVAVGFGAVDNPQVRNVFSAYRDISGAKKAAAVWGFNEKLPLLAAVFINAMLSHTLELDDVHTNSKTHIGTVVIPAAWGLAEAFNRSGRQFLLAVICGYETTARIGMGFGVSSHRNRGWHVTSTAGTFGAAAACAKLLGLDEAKTVYALGIAGTQSCGLWSFLGDASSNKVLHPARAAVSGTEAAILAHAGMTGPEHVLDAADGGLFPAMSDAYDYAAVSRGLGSIWELTQVDNKPYPCCRSTHCAIDAALMLRSHYQVKSEQIDRIQVETYLVGKKQCGAAESSLNPRFPIDAKFSTPYTVACALLFGEVTLQHFEPDALKNPAVFELLRKVTVVSDDRFTSAYPAHWGCEVHIHLKDGQTLSQTVTDASGSVSNPLTAEQVVQKASALLRVIGGEKTEEIVGNLLKIGRAPTMPAIESHAKR